MEQVIKRNNVRISGKGEDRIMFAHGFMGDQNLWRLVAPAFEDKYRVILFDYVGAGQSDKKAYDKERYSSLEGYAKDVLEICEALQLNNLIFVGHSVSSMIGLIAAIACPEYFAKMIFVAPSPCYINDRSYFGGFHRDEINTFMEAMEKDFPRWASETASFAMNAPDKPELSQELLSMLLKSDRTITKNFALATFFSDYRKDLLKFKIPSVILQCTDDKMAPLQVGDYLHAHLDHCTLKILKAKGHFPHLSAPAEVISCIEVFLADLKKPV